MMVRKNKDLWIRAAKELTLEKVKRNKFIIKAGEVGTKYYIIMSGTVSIHVPEPPTKFVFDQKEYVRFLKKYQGMILTINWEKDFEIPDELFNKKTLKRTKQVSK